MENIHQIQVQTEAEGRGLFDGVYFPFTLHRRVYPTYTYLSLNPKKEFILTVFISLQWCVLPVFIVSREYSEYTLAEALCDEWGCTLR